MKSSFSVRIYTGLASTLQRWHVDLIHFTRPWRKEAFEKITQIRKERHFLLSYTDAYNLISLIKSVKKVKGAVVEIGCYTGGSSKLLAQHETEKEIIIIDSFAGLPEVTEIDKMSGFHKGAYTASFESVSEYLKEFKNVTILQGFFPQHNSEKLAEMRFSFVHLDIDLYEPTKECLDFFYPRMAVGGVIVSHDYQTPGIQKAFEEFFRDKPDPVIEMLEHQCAVVKV
jgi:O-methyltransferase